MCRILHIILVVTHIENDEINKDNFNIYLEEKINDDEFVKDMFNDIFVN